MVKPPKRFRSTPAKTAFEKQIADAQKRWAAQDSAVKTVARTTRVAPKDLFVSKPPKAMKKRLEKIMSVERSDLDLKMIGYILQSTVIEKDISKSTSPFMWKNSSGTGKLFTNTDRKKAARLISLAMYKAFKDAAIGLGGVDVTGKKPEDIVKAVQANARKKNVNVSIGYNNTTRGIYYKSNLAGNQYDSFSVWANKVKMSLIEKFDEDHPVTIYLKPDEEWLEEKNRARADINQRLRRGEITKRQATAERKQVRTAYQQRTGKPGYEGTAYGHAFGSGASLAALFLDDPDDISHSYDPKTFKEANLKIIPGFTPRGEGVIRSKVFNTIKDDSDLIIERTYNSKKAQTSLVIISEENHITNHLGGAQVGPRTRALSKYADFAVNDIANWSGSPSFNQMLVEIVQSMLTGESIRTQKFVTRDTIKGRAKSTITMVEPSGFKGKPKWETSEPVESDQMSSVNLQSLINLVNNRLHDQIQQNMGKGGAREILNYRTGRFARSVKLQNLYAIAEKRALGAQVKYMRYPYGVFEPGGRLYKPGRDPHRIIGRSIRQILQEERIANLRKVKVQLNG